ncbi:GGDEF domain-containing protein [Salinisphaera aquimarina]|uniref:diguanylate cyclase n=2 Tax=Salinisphaera aquimarina TaxID=2094031 RepID=A0ABV7EN98_9GAMM
MAMPSGSRAAEPIPAHVHRRPVLQVLLWFTAAFGTIFAILNYRNGNYGIMAAEIVMGVFALSLLRIVRRTVHLQRWILVYLVPFFSVMMYALTTSLAAPTIFAWVLLIPILSHLLLGRWVGGAMAAFYMLVAGAIFFWKFGLDPGFGNARSVANVALASVCIFGFSYVYEVSRENAENQLRRMALTDPLTGLPNRARLGEVFDSEKARHLRSGTPLCLLMIDLDHFKQVNDRYGHDAGDAVLCFVADTLRERLRPSDLACRLGGEEFGIFLAETESRQARAVAEDLRGAIAAEPCRRADQAIDLSMSIGIAQLGPDGDDLETLFNAADQRLYQAKIGGRNQVVG